jgi:hypothetical protein
LAADSLPSFLAGSLGLPAILEGRGGVLKFNSVLP